MTEALAYTLDVTSPAACLARAQSLGLRAERVEVWRGELVREVRLRAPAVAGHTLDLDVAPSADGLERARTWVMRACRSPAHVIEAERLYSEPRESTDATDAIERADAVWHAWALAYPSEAVASAVLSAVLALVPPLEEREERLVTVAQVAHVLGRPIDDVRAMVRRGDVRTVREGRARLVPWSELERLVGSR